MKKSVVFLADGFEEIEAVTVIDYLRRAGQEVYTVAVPSKTMKTENQATGAHNIPVTADLTFTSFSEMFSKNLPDLMYIPGGIPGAPNNAACEPLAEFIIKMFNAGKIVSAICASPAVVLAKTGILKGKKWTCYPEMEKNLDQYCGSHENAEKFMAGASHISGKPFVTDKNVVTGRGPGATEQFAMELVRLLTDDETAAKIKAASVQR